MDEQNTPKDASLKCTGIPGSSRPGASLYKSVKSHCCPRSWHDS
jgi:hypothetical protein